MNLNSSFYYPVALHDGGTNAVSLLAPVVEDLPVTPDVPVVLLPQNRGNRVQGLYAYKGRCWYLVLPLYEVSRSIIRGDALDVYANLDAPQIVPPTSFLWGNGGRVISNTMEPGKLLYLVQTPPAQSGGGGGDVTSVNGQTGVVTISAANLPGLAAVGRTGSYADLIDAPNLAPVATTGNYADLTNTPAPYTLPAASATVRGGIRVGTGLTIDGQGILSATAVPYVLPSATASVLGGVKIGANLTVLGDGTLNAPAPYSLPIAAAGSLGGIRVGTGLTIDAQGILSTTGTGYVLPEATASVLGGIKVGANLSVTADGTLSAAAPYTLPLATTSSVGGVQVGTGLTINAQGVLNATPYTLPAATAGALGGIRVGSGLSIDGSGILSATPTPYTLPPATTTTLGGISVGAGLAVTAGGALSVVPTIASAATLGSIRVGTGLTINATTGVLDATATPYTLPPATASVLGGVMVGPGLAISPEGLLVAPEYQLPAATTTTRGGITVGAGLVVDASGVLSATGGDYTLPEATATVLGGVKIGANVNVTADGTISVAAPYSLPAATTTTRGGITVGAGLTVDANGLLSATGGDYTLPAATTTVIGGVSVPVSGNLSVTAGGALSVSASLMTTINEKIGSATNAGNGVSLFESDTGDVLTLRTLSGAGGVSVTRDAGDITITGPGAYTLPTASASVLGGVRVGAGLTIDGSGVLVAPSYQLPPATGANLGGIRIGTGLRDEDGNGRVAIQIATAAILGGVRVGTGLSIDAGTGILSATGTAGVTSFNGLTGAVTLSRGAGIEFTSDGQDLEIALDPSGVAASTYTKVTVDTLGRVTAGAQLNPGDVTTALGYTPVDRAGDQLSGALDEAPPVSIASAATVDLNSVDSNNVVISGTTSITSLGEGGAGHLRRVIFTSSLTLVHNSTGLWLPGGADIQTADGDVAEFLSLGASIWKCTSYMKANGTPIAGGGATYSAGTGLSLVGNEFSITPSGATAGTYTKVTVNASGQVTVGAQLAASDVTTALTYTPVNKAGDSLTGALNEAPPVSVASGATANIAGAASNNVTITGNTTITAFGTIAAGAVRRLTFLTVLTLTHNATSLILPTGANITTAGGDVAEFVSLGGGNWRCTAYQRANGTALAGGTPFSATQVFDGSQTAVGMKTRNIMEKILISSVPLTGGIAADLASGSVLYSTVAASANWTLNLRHSGTVAINTVMDFADTLTYTHLVTQGATAYLPTAFQIDGVAQTINWQGGSAPTAGNPNAIDAFVYTIIKTAANTYTVLGTMSKFGGS